MFARTPRWWEDRKTLTSAKEILRGYLDAFEPDFVVVTDERQSATLDVEKERILTMEDVLARGRDENVHHGLSVIHLYRALYEREFQFVRRHPFKAVSPDCTVDGLSLFGAACFGAFPIEDELKYFHEDYKEAFDAAPISVDQSNFFEVLTGGDGTPLRLGSDGLNVRRRAWSSGPTVFFMDGRSSSDIIDYWNLRALGWDILPLPMQWADGLAAPCKRFVEENHVPLRQNPQIFIRTTLLKSRKVVMSTAESFYRAIRPDKPGDPAALFQTWYPRLWDEWARDKDHVQRCEISSRDESLDCVPDDERIAFATLSPSFAEDARLTGTPKWANVVRVRDYWPGTETARVLPPRLPNIARLLESYGHREVSATSEGIVVCCEYSNLACRWRLPKGVPILQTWFAEKGLTVDLSGAGRIALQLTRSLGGPSGASLIAHPDIVRLLDEMAHGEVEHQEEGNGSTRGRRISRARFITKDRWYGLLKKIHGNNVQRARRDWDELVQRRILRLGLHLKCPKCAQTTWYPLDAISSELDCERCAEKIPFPKADPPRDCWSYCTQGPFTVEGFAQGSYTVALALRFFTVALHGEATWATALEDSAKKLEIDFSLWWERNSYGESNPTFVLGECKTFNPFQQKDVARARTLARMFPGAVLVFATLRAALTPAERRLIGGFARSGRRHLHAGKTYAPVLVLTSHELCHDMGPPYCWQKAGGRLAEFAKHYRDLGGLPELCDATQQLHLGMEPYGEWLRRDMERRKQQWERLRARQSKQI